METRMGGWLGSYRTIWPSKGLIFEKQWQFSDSGQRQGLTGEGPTRAWGEASGNLVWSGVQQIRMRECGAVAQLVER